MKLRQLWEEKHLLRFTNKEYIKLKVSKLLKVSYLLSETKNTLICSFHPFLPYCILQIMKEK